MIKAFLGPVSGEMSLLKVGTMGKITKKPILFSVVAGIAVISGNGAFAQESAQIDRELADGIDFRTLAFSQCLDRTECSAEGVTIIAQRRENEESEWFSAPIYWDPIDGIGVQDGAQNDEIDIDERILVRFDETINLDRIWLSDLFINEDRRYGSSQTDLVIGEPEDAEIAGLTFMADGVDVANITVAGEVRLPWAQFNREVDTRFIENGDLRRRIVVNDDVVTVVVPGADIILQTPVTADDKAKQGLFDGLETVELDITDLLAEFNQAALFEVGTTNFELINAIAENPENLSRLYEIAQDKRVSVQMSNGEVGFDVDPTLGIQEIVFFSPFDASNDFSVAGVILRK